MVIKSSQRAGSKQLATHLMADENERAELVDSRGVFSRDVAGALAEFEAVAKGTRASKHLYHVSVSPEESAKMSRQDWKKTWQLHDKIHRLSGLPFVEVEHEKNGRIHRHRVYSRIDPETGTARNHDWTRIKNERIARQREVELGHTITHGKHNWAVLSALEGEGLTEIAGQLRAAGLATAAPAIPAYTPKEWQAAKRGAPIDQVREALAECWRSSDSPQAFEAALVARGFALAQGDKVPVAVGLDGQEIPLLRAINAARKKAGESAIKKADLADSLPDQLPDLDAVREAQAEREAQQTPQQPGQPQEVDDMNPTDNMADIGRLAPAGKAEEAIKADQDKPQWLKFRERMLYRHYGEGLEGSDLAKYWRVEQGEGGQVRFSNKSGEIIDRGEVLDVNSPKQHAAKAAAAAVAIAKAKGWDEVRATGSQEFKAAIFRAAQEAHLAVAIDNKEDRELYLSIAKGIEVNIEPEEGNPLADVQAEQEEAQAYDMDKVRERFKERTGQELEARAGASASNEAAPVEEAGQGPKQGHGQTQKHGPNQD